MLLRAAPSRPRSMPAMSSGQIPTPVRGLQLKSGIASMKADEALILDNWRPEGGFCRVRGGHVSHATGLGASIGSVMEWAGPSSRKMFAATVDEIYDVTAPGAVGAPEVTGMGSAYWQTVNFTTPGGNFLVMCNGVNSVRNYDGTAWTTPAITGVTSSTLINVASYKSRLWFVEAGSTRAWYLGTSSIAGAANSVELGDKFRRGGKLMLTGAISRDAGSGAQDVICFISSKGEIAIFEGGDPADATTWRQIGLYMAAPPIGNRALAKIDGDLGLLTERGIVSLKQVAATGQATAERTSITGNIDQGIIDDFSAYGGNTGWEMALHPRTRQVIVNVPKSAAASTQYAMNIQTGAWCTYGRFASPLNATCWGTLNEKLYFGTATGTVFEAERGYQDNGAAIIGEIKTSFQSYGGGALFRMSMVRPNFTAGGEIVPALRINTDYGNDQPISADEFDAVTGALGSVWGTDLWGTGVWGSSGTPYATWLAVQGIGTTASIHMVTRTNGFTARLNAFDIRFERAKAMAL
jgi:hypothetical protein